MEYWIGRRNYFDVNLIQILVEDEEIYPAEPGFFKEQDDSLLKGGGAGENPGAIN
jgi:hypothetical protein